MTHHTSTARQELAASEKRIKAAEIEKNAGMQKESAAQRPFGKLNFIFMGASLVLIIVGFLLMSGSGSTIDGGFNPDIFSTRRIVVGPLFSFLGFLLMAPAIIYRPKKANNLNS